VPTEPLASEAMRAALAAADKAAGSSRPGRQSAACAGAYDKRKYRERNRIERHFGRLKELRAVVATR
jgi:uncharacterized Ntn-hydrolase superfamily protein